MIYEKCKKRKDTSVRTYNLMRVVRAKQRELTSEQPAIGPTDEELIQCEIDAVVTYLSEKPANLRKIRELQGFNPDTGEPPTERDPETGKLRIAIDPKTGQPWAPRRLTMADIVDNFTSDENFRKFIRNVLAPSVKDFVKPKGYRLKNRKKT